MKTIKNKLIDINIFIATPSDLEQERNIFRDVLKKINSLNKSQKFNLVPVGWEDTLIGKGRPQELINKDLAKSDLVIFILWKRWGSPSGKFSSGFEEEFFLANKLDKEMWILFKKIPTYMLEDPGPQLSKVLQFKEQIIKDKKFLFKDFTNEKDLKKILNNNLQKFLILQQNKNINRNINSNNRILTRTIKKMPQKCPSYCAFAQIALDSISRFEKKEDFKEAESVYQNYIKNIDPNNPIILFYYCDFLLKLGQHNKAIKYIRKFLKLLKDCDPEQKTLNLQAELYWTLANLYYDYSSNYLESIKNYYKAIKLFEKEKNYKNIVYCCKLLLRPLGEDGMDDNLKIRHKLLLKAYRNSIKANLHIDKVEILCSLSLIYKEKKETKLFFKTIKLAEMLIKKYKITKARPLKYVNENLKLIDL